MNKYTLRHFLLSLVLSLLVLPACAQFGEGLIKTKTHLLIGLARDNVTHETLYDVKVEMLAADADSTVLYTFVTNSSFWMSNMQGPWFVPIPHHNEPYAASKYILRFTKEGYQTKYLSYTVPRMGRNERELNIDPVNLTRLPKEQELGEATVKATRVKFYAKGDTIVYNADAFQLNEGSMLDALIRQMPGVELKSDGRIYVNGKYVESLLLNGEDFFKGNNQMMLDNLPTYMVHNIKVYNKAGVDSELSGKNKGDQAFVMDVKLKKQYNIGWMGNVDVAGGTEDRYMARFFAMRYTDHSRLSFYGSLNNVNETRKPGEDTDWSPQIGDDGITTTRQGGMDYLINDRNKRFKLNGSALVRHDDDVADVRTNTTNFFSSGDTYYRSRNTSRLHSFWVETDHEFQLKPWKKASLYLNPSFYYMRQRKHSGFVSGSFASNPDNYMTDGVLDSLFRPDLSTALLAQTLNRYRNQGYITGDRLDAKLFANVYVSIPHTNDDLTIKYSGKFHDEDYQHFNLKQYDYPNSDGTSNSWRNEYQTKPSRQVDNYAQLAYNHSIGSTWSVAVAYSYNNTYERNNGGIYRLDRLEGWGEESNNPLGMLPSVTDWQRQTLDGINTTRTTLHHDAHTAGIYINKYNDFDSWWTLNLSLPVKFNHQQMNYLRPALIDTAMTRRFVTFFPSWKVERNWYTFDKGTSNVIKWHTLTFDGSVTSSIQDFNYAVTLPYDRDPLAITYGNDHLKMTWKYNAELLYSFGHQRKERTAGLFVNYTLWQNKLAMGYTYNRSTGGYIYTPDNVNGNYQLRGGGNFSFALDKRHRLTLSGNTEANYLHNVDLIGIDGMTNGNLRSTVGTIYLTQGLNLAYNFGKVKLGAKANGTWTHATSERTDFTDISAADFNYGLTFKADLPAAFTFSTDFTVYSRRGYEGHGMNTNDLVWNARLAKRFLANRLTLAVDGFDILHQLSNIRQVVNGQGRTETIRNVIPRYAMLHIIYRFNVLPKKK